MTPAPDPLSQAKAALRRAAAEARERAQGADAAAAGAALVRHGLDRLAAFRPRVVSGFWSIQSEIDVRPLMTALAAATGAALALPVVMGRGQALQFRRWDKAAALVAGPFGTAHPAEGMPVLMPDLLLVPLLAFDRRRHRLGYGAGFYDRTLAALRADGPITAVGIAYAAQEVAEVPVGAHDQVLDLVLTEQGFI
ncbi:5-formyltetrahydrofolate cyclo-ligase [Aliidongia dinghuensis]|uniref:5-formyltetrahydrofolate cyclo-ligase n=1 Tax=Aliidongia dinghuensis TaxID=1867774 RepID=A0A8J2YSR3_9PROT|nr:5-formyltetrahydrofolate cyclo-ligase [Aliidongia dinghuensis]GGF16769.1 5-formyltetrahydrofolate cyclo-ligase [Aliidongia dinghuensis]